MTKQATVQTSQFSTSALPSCSFNSIDTPGAYVSQDGSQLWRVQEDGLASGRSPRITNVSLGNPEGQSVIQISSNPNVTVQKAAQLCADHGINPGFYSGSNDA